MHWVALHEASEARRQRGEDLPVRVAQRSCERQLDQLWKVIHQIGRSGPLRQCIARDRAQYVAHAVCQWCFQRAGDASECEICQARRCVKERREIAVSERSKRIGEAEVTQCREVALRCEVRETVARDARERERDEARAGVLGDVGSEARQERESDGIERGGVCWR